jgi:hypothetical protein
VLIQGIGTKFLSNFVTYSYVLRIFKVYESTSTNKQH